MVELVGHRCRSHCRPGAEAGSSSGTEVPEPMWDRGARLSHYVDICIRGAGWTRTSDQRIMSPRCCVQASAGLCKDMPSEQDLCVVLRGR